MIGGIVQREGPVTRSMLLAMIVAAVSWIVPARAQQNEDATMCVALIAPTPNEWSGLNTFIQTITTGVSHCEAGNIINLHLAYQTTAESRQQAARVAVPLLCDYGSQIIVNVGRERDVETYSVSCVFAGVRRLVLPRQ